MSTPAQEILNDAMPAFTQGIRHFAPDTYEAENNGQVAVIEEGQSAISEINDAAGAKSHNLYPGDSFDKADIAQSLQKRALSPHNWQLVRDNFQRAGGGPAGRTVVTEFELELPELGELPKQEFAIGDKAVPSTAMGALVGEVGRRDRRFVVTNADGNEASAMKNINEALQIRHPTRDALYNQGPDRRKRLRLLTACPVMTSWRGSTNWLEPESMSETKIIVIDDDPTGSQTVHGCLLLIRWDVETLQCALRDQSPLFFILSNTRGMDAARAARVTRDICVNLKHALEASERQGGAINPIVVSRSDSTLRGHYPVETDIIADELGPFDAHFMVPAFFEAGRFTRDSVHYLVADGNPVPVHETEFARDSVFGFSTAYLPDYVEEKTRGRIRAGQVDRFLLGDVHNDCRQRLRKLVDNVCCAVDCETQADLNQFAAQLQEVAREGKRFLFRSAASLLTALAKLSAQPVEAEDMAVYARDQKTGVILIGSHVARTSVQLAYLRKHTDVVPVHVDVERLNAGNKQRWTETAASVADVVIARINAAHAGGRTVVIYTSRQQLQFPSQAERLAFGERLSAFLMDLVRRLPETIGFLISKGGITSNDVLSSGLKLKQSRVLGQILTGCSVIRCPSDHQRYPELPVVIFPGNVGDESALTKAYTILAARQKRQPIYQTA